MALPALTKTWQFWYIMGGASTGLSPQRYVLHQGTAPTVSSTATGTQVVIKNLINTDDSQFGFSVLDKSPEPFANPRRLYLSGFGGGSAGLNTNGTDGYGWPILSVDTTPGTQATKTVTISYTGAATTNDAGTGWSRREPSTNKLLASSGVVATDNRLFSNTILRMLKGFPLNPWITVGSGTTADSNSFNSTDGIDRIATTGANGSWHILKQAALDGTTPGSHFQLCHMNNSDSQSHYIFISQAAGFTGSSNGTISTTQCPSATDQLGNMCRDANNTPAYNNTAYLISLNLAYSTNGQRLNVAMSTDGTCFRTWGYYQSSTTHFWVLDQPINCLASTNPPQASVFTWNANNQPYYMFARCCGATTLYRDVQYDPSRNGYFSSANGTVTRLGSANTTWNGALFQAQNGGILLSTAYDYTNERPVVPIALYATAAGAKGILGYTPDMWFADNNLDQGATFGASKQFISVGNYMLPWDGSAVNIGS